MKRYPNGLFIDIIITHNEKQMNQVSTEQKNGM